MIQKGLIVGIDASRNRSGGAKSHLIGLLLESDPSTHGVHEVHVWSFKSLLDVLPNRPWLVKHNPKALEQSVIQQMRWQRYQFSKELKQQGCDIVLNTSAGTLSRFHPAITMSREMICYESGEIERFGFTKMRLRLILLRCLQNRSFRRADAVIFLTKHAAEAVQKSTGPLKQIAYIPHGIGENFKNQTATQPWPEPNTRSIRCLYISNTDMYKHQWVVVRAIEELRKRGYDISLTLVGGGEGKAQKLLERQLAQSDPTQAFTCQTGFVAQHDLPHYLSEADIFIFASSCENMPNTLLEAMAVGLPIACSERGPMPEVLQEGGVYFDPENADSIAHAVQVIIQNESLRTKIIARSQLLSTQYSWSRCTNETFQFIVDTWRKLR